MPWAGAAIATSRSEAQAEARAGARRRRAPVRTVAASPIDTKTTFPTESRSERRAGEGRAAHAALRRVPSPLILGRVEAQEQGNQGVPRHPCFIPSLQGRAQSRHPQTRSAGGGDRVGCRALRTPGPPPDRKRRINRKRLPINGLELLGFAAKTRDPSIRGLGGRSRSRSLLRAWWARDSSTRLLFGNVDALFDQQGVQIQRQGRRIRPLRRLVRVPIRTVPPRLALRPGPVQDAEHVG